MTLVTTTSKNHAVLTTIPGLSVANRTPLLAGVRTGIGMFGREINRAIVLLSDGYHNCPGLVGVGDAAVTSLISDLNSDSIRMFSIGFGRPTDIDHPLLEALADRTTPAGFTGSQFHDVTTAGFDPSTWVPATALQATYKAILADALGLQTGVDPAGLIGAGETKSFPIALNSHDRKVSFYVGWESPVADRLRLQLRASDGSVVPGGATGVVEHKGEAHHIITVSREFLRQPGKVGNAPWMLEIIYAGVEAETSEHYQYGVVMDSGLRLHAGTQRRDYHAGDSILLTARLQVADKPLTDIGDVYAEVLTPSAGLGNWFAKYPVSASVLAKYRQRLDTETLAPVAQKAHYLGNVMDLQFPGAKPSRQIKLNDRGTEGDAVAGDGIYSVNFTDTGLPGTYSFRVVARGDAPGPGTFHRENMIQHRVEVAPDAGSTVVFVSLRERLDDLLLYELKVVPRDRLGNFTHPALASSIKLWVSQGELEGAVTADLQGGYSQMLVLPKSVELRDVDLSLDWGRDRLRFNLGEAKPGKDPGQKH
jgi:hypothetical protein